MSKAHLGKPVWNKGLKGVQIAWNKGLKGFMAGEKNPAWKGGISFEPYGLDWTKALKELIKARDNYTCKICSINKGVLVHHIDYNKRNCSPKNLITLCRNCHSRTNAHREKWKNFFKNLFKT
jgi:5-methylcytosine-specific restriction endonuclease McrA